MANIVAALRAYGLRRGGATRLGMAALWFASWRRSAPGDGSSMVRIVAALRAWGRQLYGYHCCGAPRLGLTAGLARRAIYMLAVGEAHGPRRCILMSRVAAAPLPE